MTEEGTVNEEEGEEFKQENKSEEEEKGIQGRRERREKREEERQNMQARRVQHFTEVDHQTQTAPPAHRAKIWADLTYIWAQEEFNTVRGPNFNPDWITW